MPARTPGNEISKRPSASMDLEQQQAGVIGNERLTALVSLVLLVLLIVELVTSALLRIWLAAHTVVGVLLVGPLLVKMGSTFWRFLRYYTSAPVPCGDPAVRVGSDERHWRGSIPCGHGGCSADDPLHQAVEMGKVGEGGVGALPARAESATLWAGSARHLCLAHSFPFLFRSQLMKAYSQDVRDQVLRAVDDGYLRAEVVQMFGISLATRHSVCEATTRGRTCAVQNDSWSPSDETGTGGSGRACPIARDIPPANLA
jgi:hypothetical protein